MKAPDFDGLLAEYCRTSVPALPSSFSANVLREIRLRGAEIKKESGWVASMFSCLSPGMVAASLSVALVVGVFAPGLARGSDASMAANGLGLNAFSTSKMPSGLLR
ncbi:MAG: hypothetical protein WC003_02120 [Terrimicrobiaceae bacterium]|jgi:hypothetical protein